METKKAASIEAAFEKIGESKDLVGRLCRVVLIVKLRVKFEDLRRFEILV